MPKLTDLLLREAEVVELYAGQKLRPTRMPRTVGLFDPVPLAWLTDRHWDSMFPARLRLYLYLRIKSRRGSSPVTLTNKMTETLGITGHHKATYLKYLENRGLIVVDRRGHSTLIVSVVSVVPVD